MRKWILKSQKTSPVLFRNSKEKFQITFNVPEEDQIKLLEILSDELIDTELMNEESGSIKCRFAILTPAAWINWIKGQIGLDIMKNDVHVNKDESKVFIRFFSLGTDL